MDAGDDIYIVTDGTLRTLPSVQMLARLFSAKLEGALQSILQQYQADSGQADRAGRRGAAALPASASQMPLSGWSSSTCSWSTSGAC